MSGPDAGRTGPKIWPGSGHQNRAGLGLHSGLDPAWLIWPKSGCRIWTKGKSYIEARCGPYPAARSKLEENHMGPHVGQDVRIAFGNTGTLEYRIISIRCRRRRLQTYPKHIGPHIHVGPNNISSIEKCTNIFFRMYCSFRVRTQCTIKYNTSTA